MEQSKEAYYVLSGKSDKNTADMAWLKGTTRPWQPHWEREPPVVMVCP